MVYVKVNGFSETQNIASDDRREQNPGEREIAEATEKAGLFYELMRGATIEQNKKRSNHPRPLHVIQEKTCYMMLKTYTPAYQGFSLALRRFQYPNPKTPLIGYEKAPLPGYPFSLTYDVQ